MKRFVVLAGCLAACACLGLPTQAPAREAKKAATKKEKPETDPALRGRIAALVLRRADFGAYSLLPVRFAESRLSGPFEDGGRTTWCVSSQMHGRSFGKPERPRAIVRMESGALRISEYDSDICGGHRSEPFPEFETLANRKE